MLPLKAFIQWLKYGNKKITLEREWGSLTLSNKSIVIANSYSHFFWGEERGGENGLDYSYVVGSPHPVGTLLKTPDGNSRWFNIFVSSFPQTIARNLQLEGTSTERLCERWKLYMTKVLPCLRKIAKNCKLDKLASRLI